MGQREELLDGWIETDDVPVTAVGFACGDLVGLVDPLKVGPAFAGWHLKTESWVEWLLRSVCGCVTEQEPHPVKGVEGIVVGSYGEFFAVRVTLEIAGTEPVTVTRLLEPAGLFRVAGATAGAGQAMPASETRLPSALASTTGADLQSESMVVAGSQTVASSERALYQAAPTLPVNSSDDHVSDTDSSNTVHVFV